MKDTRTIAQVAEGLRIITERGGKCVVAEHDELYAGHEVKSMPREERELLEKLGWERDDSLGCWRRSVG